jgi:hypothetical protein
MDRTSCSANDVASPDPRTGCALRRRRLQAADGDLQPGGTGSERHREISLASDTSVERNEAAERRHDRVTCCRSIFEATITRTPPARGWSIAVDDGCRDRGEPAWLRRARSVDDAAVSLDRVTNVRRGNDRTDHHRDDSPEPQHGLGRIRSTRQLAGANEDAAPNGCGSEKHEIRSRPTRLRSRRA